VIHIEHSPGCPKNQQMDIKRSCKDQALKALKTLCLFLSKAAAFSLFKALKGNVLTTGASHLQSLQPGVKKTGKMIEANVQKPYFFFVVHVFIVSDKLFNFKNF
jgi:hypothetical protein